MGWKIQLSNLGDWGTQVPPIIIHHPWEKERNRVSAGHNHDTSSVCTAGTRKQAMCSRLWAFCQLPVLPRLSLTHPVPNGLLVRLSPSGQHETRGCPESQKKENEGKG